MRVPVSAMNACTLCGGRYEIYPELFRLNDAGFIEVAEMECYPEDEVDDAIKHCPQDCIHWEEM